MGPKTPFLTAEWRYLVMLNYEIDPAILKPHVPPGTELDSYQGQTLISVVGFLFLNTRVKRVPIPGHRNFEEINLRFYVRRKAADGWRRGVVFIKEIVPRRAIALIARWFYNENYVAHAMRHTIQTGPNGDPQQVAYGWKFGREWLSMQVEVGDDPALPSSGSEPEFITEHYWGYTTQRDGGCLEYEVAHPQWRVWPARQAQLRGDVGRFYGAAFGDCLQETPTSAFVADGSPVTVYAGQRIV